MPPGGEDVAQMCEQGWGLGPRAGCIVKGSAQGLATQPGQLTQAPGPVS